MQGARHINTGVIVIRTFKAYIFGGGVSADQFEKIRETYAAPFTNGAPAFNADMACDLAGLWQHRELGETPRFSVFNQPAEFQFEGAAVNNADFIFTVIGIERKWLGDHAFGISRCHFIGVKQKSLYFVIPA